MYFHYLTVVKNKGQVAFHKEIELFTTYLAVVFSAIATKTVTQTVGVLLVHFILFFSTPINLLVYTI